MEQQVLAARLGGLELATVEPLDAGGAATRVGRTDRQLLARQRRPKALGQPQDRVALCHSPIMKTDSLARATALELAAARLAIGTGTLFATRPALDVLGFAQTDAAGRALAKVLGARDLALGAVTVASRDDRRALRATTLVGAALDAGDAVAFALAVRDPATRRAGAGGLLAAGVAAAVGLWAARRLG